MSIGFIMYEIVDKDSLKYQGINTAQYLDKYCEGVRYSLKNQGINTPAYKRRITLSLDIHLKIRVLTPALGGY